jgi:hypothetical protein
MVKITGICRKIMRQQRSTVSDGRWRRSQRVKKISKIISV